VRPAKHFAPRFREGGAIALFSGFAARRLAPGHQAALQALANPFVTGTVLHVDGGARARLKRWVNEPLHEAERFL